MATEYTFDMDIYSDLHKDAYGFRPRSGNEFYDPATTDDRRQELWDQTYDALVLSIELEKEEQSDAAIRFDARIMEARELGARDTETAIRWILDGEGIAADDCIYGADYVAYYFGLSYQNQWREIIGKIADQICKEDRENGSVAAD